jgi:cytochrome c
MKRRLPSLACAAAAFLLAGLAAFPAARLPAAQAGGDWDAGSDVFDTYCSDCHSVSPKSLNRKGPTLYRVMGRRAGTIAGYDYSQGMRSSGIVWNPASLNAYLANPRGLIKDGKMKKGLPKPADRANVIAFLARPE